MEYKNLKVSFDESVAIITINRPEKLNALNLETLDELKRIFTDLKNDNQILVIILTGSGEKAFVAGADISELNKLNVISGKEFSEKGQNVFNLIENMNKPVIAAVNGFALGGGCELALSCHIRFASTNAKFAQPEINLGIIPGYGGSQRLTKLVNSGRAFEYILSGDRIDSEEAYRVGLVNKIFPSEELLENTIRFAKKISSKPRNAVRFALEAVRRNNEVSLSMGLNFEASLFSLCCGTEDFKEGTRAFLEKRKPVFKNK